MIFEPVQNAGGCFMPQEGYWQRVREICDQYGVLLISDEVICSWGRLGHYFGAQRFDYAPDIITTAKGLTSAYSPMGAVIASDKVAEPFMEHEHVHPRPHLRRTPGDRCGGDGQPRHLRARGPVRPRAREGGRVPRPARGPARHPDRRRRARRRFFHSIELVKDQDTKESFSDEESESLLRGYLSGALYENGLICRADDRGDPVIQLRRR